MLIKLYDLPAPTSPPRAIDATVRKPIAPEHDLVIAWIAGTFGASWASEARAALANRPLTLYVAVQEGRPVGFACYDATARGMVGPVGVDPACRGAGLGEALLRACLADMRSGGYAYAVAGWVGPIDFFRRVAGATVIPATEPGHYAGMMRL